MQEQYLLIVEKRENSSVFFYVFRREFREEKRKNLPKKWSKTT